MKLLLAGNRPWKNIMLLPEDEAFQNAGERIIRFEV